MKTTGTAAPERSANRRAPLAGRAAAVVAAAATCLTGLIGAAPASAQETGADIVAVEFDLGEEFGEEGSLQPIGPSQPISYRTVTVNHGGHEIKLVPAPQPSVTEFRSLGFDDLASVGFGSVVESSGEGAPDRLGASLSSAYVHESIWNRGNGPVDVDVSFAEPLADWDFFMIQEASGDATIDLAATSGDSVSPAVTIAGYDWDTGYPASTDVDGRHWARVVPVSALPGEQSEIDGLALTLPAGTDVKIVPLKVVSTRPPVAQDQPETNSDTDSSGSLAGAEASTGGDKSGGNESGGDESRDDGNKTPDSTPGDGGGDRDGAESGADESQPAVAAVGLSATFRPGVSEGGASCVDPSLEGALAIALPGEQATYCFAVTNLGTTPLDQIKVTDAALGIDAGSLPLASGSEVIRPGETSVFFHHASIGARGTGAVSSVTAAAAGAELEAPRAESSELTAALGQVAPADGPQADASSAPAPKPTAAAPAPTTTAPPATTAPTAAQTEADSTTAAQTDDGSGSGDGGTGSGEAELAFTGPGIEPWVLLVFATAFMFFGYTLTVAFRRSPMWAKLTGHAQLDAMGFDRY